MTVRLHDLAGESGARFSPFCWRARMALAHKGVAHEALPARYADIAGLCGGGHKSVPVLETPDKVVGDSWDIALYLEEAYPDAPTLFGGPQGLAMTRFIESWTAASLHAVIITLCIKDIHDRLDPADRDYFRESREKRFGRPLEDVQQGREERLAGLHKALTPLALMLRKQPFIGGDTPLFADYIVFAALQWPRVASDFHVLPPDGDPVTQWFERCLDLHDGLGRAAKAAA